MSETPSLNSRRRRRMQRFLGFRHVLVGVTLALSGIGAITGEHWSWADVVGMIGGVALLIAFIREIRGEHHATGKPGEQAHRHVGWVDVFAAVVTAVEAWHLHHQGKHGLPIVYGLVALFLLLLGLAHSRITRLLGPA